jgi:hypothetical protein
MTVEQLRSTHRAAPFRPFVIHMADGRTFTIKHPDYLFIMPPGRTVIVVDYDGSFSILDLLLATELRVSSAQANSSN